VKRPSRIRAIKSVDARSRYPYTMKRVRKRSRHGVATVTVRTSATYTDLISIVDEVAGLIREESGVERVLIHVDGDGPDALRYLVRLLDSRAREYGKRVELTGSLALRSVPA
jgi:hypothetical protein